MPRSQFGRFVRVRALIVLGSVLLCGAVAGAPSDARSPAPAQASPSITIDARAPAHPFSHYWERMFGSGRAILSLRESYRRDLREVRHATGFEYIRFHGILDEDVGVYSEDAQGRPVFNRGPGFVVSDSACTPPGGHSI